MVPRKALIHPHRSNDLNFGIQGIDFCSQSSLHESDEAVKESGLISHLINHGYVDNIFAKSCDNLVCPLLGSALNIMHDLPDKGKCLLDVTLMLLSQAVFPMTSPIFIHLFLKHLACPDINQQPLEINGPLLSVSCEFVGDTF